MKTIILYNTLPRYLAISWSIRLQTHDPMKVHKCRSSHVLKLQDSSRGATKNAALQLLRVWKSYESIGGSNVS